MYRKEFTKVTDEMLYKSMSGVYAHVALSTITNGITSILPPDSR